MEKSVTRRNFLIGGAAVSGIAALGLVGCSSTESSSGTPTAETGSDQVITPTYPAYARTLDVTEKDIVRTEDADVVVVGSGSAGTFAAIRAAERGAHVIWLEKTTAKGGTSTITEGLTAFDGEQPRVRLAISTAFIRPLWIGTTGGPKQRLSKPTSTLAAKLLTGPYPMVPAWFTAETPKSPTTALLTLKATG